MAGVAGAPSPTVPSAARVQRPLRFDAAQLAIHPSHVRTLLWLRLRLTLRRYTRSVRAIIGLVVMVLFLAAITFLLGSGSFFLYTALPQPSAAQMLITVVGVLYIVWALLPLLQYSLNEGLDVTKLQTYPLTRGEQMVSLVLATLLDMSTIAILGLYGVIIATWHASPLATALTVVALVIAYTHTVAFSQLIIAWLMGLLRSRRFRDITIIFFAMIGFFISIGSQLIARSGISFSDPSALRLGDYLRWTPPGMAAQSIALVNQGQYAFGLIWLVASLVLVPVVLALWGILLERGIVNAESAGSVGARRRGGLLTRLFGGARTAPAAPVATAQAASAATLVVPAASVAVAQPARRSIFSSAASAIALKEIRYLWRDPQLKASLLSSLFLVVVVLLPGLYGCRSASITGSGDTWTVLLSPLPALSVVLVLAINSLGMERQGLQTLFLFPVRPLDIFWGKNLVVGTLAFGLEAVLVVIKSVLLHDWSLALPALVIGIAAILVLMGCGNVTSVVTPFRWRQMRMGETSTMSSENGCLRSVTQMVVMALSAVLLLPVAVAIGVPLLLAHSGWLFVTLPVALLYGIVFYQAATRLIAPVLLRRAPEILNATVREA